MEYRILRLTSIILVFLFMGGINAEHSPSMFQSVSKIRQFVKSLGYYKRKVAIKKRADNVRAIFQSCKGPRGPQGPMGPPGPAAPQSWVQLHDGSYENILTGLDYLNLSDEGIDFRFTTGGYSLLPAPGGVANGVLTFPEPGHYRVFVSLKANFKFADDSFNFGDLYTVGFDVLGIENDTLSSMSYMGMIPNPNAQANDIIQFVMSTEFILYEPLLAPQISMRLRAFDFGLALDAQLIVHDIHVQVQQLRQ